MTVTILLTVIMCVAVPDDLVCGVLSAVCRCAYRVDLFVDLKD